MFMYWERQSLLDRLIEVLIGLSGLIVFFAIFMAGIWLQQGKENLAKTQLNAFLQDVADGFYDDRRGGYPPEIEVYALDGNYVYGKIYAYSFSGYFGNQADSESLTWRFSGHQEFSVEFLMQLVGFTGMIFCSGWFIISRLVLKVSSVRELIDNLKA